MAYSKIDCVIYKIIWINSTGKNIDITQYVTSHSSEEGTSLVNSKIDLRLKLIKQEDITINGTDYVVPFYADSEGKSSLKTDNYLQVYVKYHDGTDIDTTQTTDLMKTYYVTDWDVNEPDNLLTINAVDLNYKVTNRTISKGYGQRFDNDTGFTATGTTLTDASKSFPVPGSDDTYTDGLKWQTLELEDNSGNVYTYLITNNTATTCTTHKTIEVATWSNYRIGWSSPAAIFHAIDTTARINNGRGQAYQRINLSRVTTVQGNYRSGIQFLRKDPSLNTGNTTNDSWAFPIISIGESFMPMYKFITEVSSFSACNTENELANQDLIIKRDMIFNITWEDSLKQMSVNWFYADTPERSASIGTISSVSANTLNFTGYSTSSSDLGKVVRVAFTRNSKLHYKSYQVTAYASGQFTVYPDPVQDGITASDTFYVYGSVDFIWDNDEDYKHIYNYKLGSKDEERFNQVLFNAGKNDVAGREILGHWFNGQTESDTLKDTFIPMTFIAKKMIQYEQQVEHIRLTNGTWEGADGLGGFTSVAADWDFTTNFGNFSVDPNPATYTIASRTDFNTYFRESARKRAQQVAKTIAISQKENNLQGTIQIRGQRFITATSSGAQTIKWYQQGTRILFKKPDAGLNNIGNRYFTFVVTKIRHQIDSTRWITFLDVIYDYYDIEDLMGGL